MKKITSTIILCCCFLITKAQVNSKDTITFSIQNLDEVVISANKVPEKKRTVSQRVETISRREIQMQNFQNTADLLANSGVVNVQKSQQGGGSVVIRGLESNRILYLIDGVRMNNLIFRGGHLQNVITVDENILERADVLFGPASSIYGSDALGGAVHLHTIKPMLLDEAGKAVSGNAFVRYSSANQEKKGHLSFNIAGKRFASRTAFTYSDFGDLRMGSRPFGNNDFFGARNYYIQRINGIDSLVLNADSLVQKFSGYKQYDLLQKFVYKASDKVQHDLNFQFSTSSDVPRYDRLTDPQGSGLRNAEWYYGPQKRLLAGYNVNATDLFSGHNLHIGLHYQDVEESRHQRRVGRSALQHRYEKVNIVNLNADLSKNLPKGQLRYGLEVELDRLKSTAEQENINTGETSPLDTRYPNGDNSMSHTAAYASLSHYFSEKTTLSASGRLGYSTLSSTHTDTVFFKLPFTRIQQKNLTYSASVGLAHNPSEQVKLSFNVATGFRVPNVDDVGKIFETAPGMLIVPNNDIKPEKTVSVDGGLSLIKNQSFYWETSVFYTRLFDAIVAAPFSFNGQDSIVYDGVLSAVVANQNQRSAYITGFSTTLEARVWSDMTVYGGMSYTYGRVAGKEEVTPLDHIPPIFGRAGARYTAKGWFVDLYVLFNSKKDIKNYYLNGEDNEQYAPEGGMPAWMTLNLKASYQWNDLMLQAGVENIMDIQYRTFASGINAPGRNIYGALRYRF